MLYIDSADTEAITRFLATGAFAGVTTNPTVLLRAGRRSRDLAEMITVARDHGAHRIFLQAVGADAPSLLEHGRTLRALGEDVVVKLPATSPGLTASARLAEDGVPVLLTAVYDAAQALLADAVGASWIAPYVGRIDDLGGDGVQETIAVHDALRTRGSSCRVLAASIRTLPQLGALAAAGVPDFTLSAPLCTELLDPEASVAAAEQFEIDSRASGTGAA